MVAALYVLPLNGWGAGFLFLPLSFKMSHMALTTTTTKTATGQRWRPRGLWKSMHQKHICLQFPWNVKKHQWRVRIADKVSSQFWGEWMPRTRDRPKSSRSRGIKHWYVASCAKPSGPTERRLVRRVDTETADHPYAYENVESARRIGQISIRSLSRYRDTASHPCAFGDGPSNGWTWCTSCCNLHNYTCGLSPSCVPNVVDPVSLMAPWVGVGQAGQILRLAAGSDHWPHCPHQECETHGP